MSSAGAYRALVRLYPRRFRDEYGADMVQLFTDQLRNEMTPRVWARSVADLVITVPAVHLEVHMSRPDPKTVTAIYAAIAVAGGFFALVAGSQIGPAALGAVAAVTAGIAAAISWRRSRTIAEPSTLVARWWQFLGAGVGMIVLIVVVTTITGELPDGAWAPTMLLLLTSVICAAFGVVLGIAHLAGRSHRPAAS